MDKNEIIKNLAVYLDDMYGIENSYQDHYDDLEFISRRIGTIILRENHRKRDLTPDRYRYEREIRDLFKDYGLARRDFARAIGLNESNVTAYVKEISISSDKVKLIEDGYERLLEFIKYMNGLDRNTKWDLSWHWNSKPFYHNRNCDWYYRRTFMELFWKFMKGEELT